MTTTGLLQVPQPTTVGYTRQNGEWSQLVQDFAGATAQADAIAFGRTQETFCESWEAVPTGGGCYRVTVKYSFESSNQGNANAPLNQAWELQPNIVEKDLMEADMSGINALTMAMKNKVRQDADSNQDTTPDYSTFSGASSGQQATMLALWKLMSHGVKSTQIHAPTLRVSSLYRPDYGGQQPVTNCGNVITDLTAEGVPSALLFNLPPSGTTRTIDSITLKYGWYKKFPTVNQVAAGRWQMQQEYAYGLYSTDLYTFV